METRTKEEAKDVKEGQYVYIARVQIGSRIEHLGAHLSENNAVRRAKEFAEDSDGNATMLHPQKFRVFV